MLIYKVEGVGFLVVQAEDGRRDGQVTGVQKGALKISGVRAVTLNARYHLMNHGPNIHDTQTVLRISLKVRLD